MTTDYDQISELYRRAKQQPWRHAVEEYSFMRLLGDLRGRRVVDLACGEGFFTRKLKEAGAASVRGTDISQAMIALARQQESADPLGIEYIVEDARAEGPRLEHDVVATAWLLVYAHHREEMDVMCRGLARQLAPGGRLVTLTTNPDVYVFPDPDYRPYGFTIDVEDEARDGAPILWTIHLDDTTSFEIENYYLPRSAIQSSLEEAGFRDVVFYDLELDPAAAARDPEGTWDEFLRYPPAVLIDAIRT